MFYPDKPGINYHHRARLHDDARRHALGAAHGRADRPDRHPLEQGLDHREQRDPLFDVRRESRSASTATSGTTRRRTPPRATSRRSSAPCRTAGRRRTSATTSCGTTTSRIASRRASSAAWARCSARSPATSSTTSTCGGCSPARRWPASRFTRAIDTEISHNHIYRTCLGIWLDWMAQGTRVTRNLLHDNEHADLFVEVDHGPFLVDNNLFLSRPRRCWTCRKAGPTCTTCSPVASSLTRSWAARPRSTRRTARRWRACRRSRAATTGSSTTSSWASSGLAPYDKAARPMQMAGNVFLKGAKPCQA